MRQSEIPGLHKRLSAYDKLAFFAQPHQIEILATLPGRIPAIAYSSMKAMVDEWLIAHAGALLAIAGAAMLRSAVPPGSKSPIPAGSERACTECRRSTTRWQ